MAGVFEGFTAVEIADRRNQFVGKLLAESGARVLQIEPIEGSPARWTGPFVEDKRDPDRCLDYWYFNTGKDSVCIDYTRAPGQELIKRLVASADIFIESARPGTMAAHGLDYASLAAVNPGLIYLSLTDFGQSGPWVDFEVNDHAHLAAGGPMASSGYSDLRETPIGGQRAHAYSMSSIVATHTITGALFERLASEQGQHIDIAIHDVVAVSTEGAVPNWLWYNQALLRQTGQHAAPRYRPDSKIVCADGFVMQTSNPTLNDRNWGPLVQWMQEVDVAEDLADAKWNDAAYRNEQLRGSESIQDGIRRLLEKVPAQEAFERGQALGMPWAVINAPEENLEAEHYRVRGYFAPVQHEEIGKTILYPRGLYSEDDLGATPSRRAPHLGEHTRPILRAELGLDEAAIATLTQTGVIR